MVVARSESPVTEPTTRDTLDTVDFGADLGAGYRFDFGPGSVTPFASVGVSRISGEFHVTSDNSVLNSTTTNPGIIAGVRLLSKLGLEGVAELVVFPGRLVHPSFSLAWVFDLSSKH